MTISVLMSRKKCLLCGRKEWSAEGGESCLEDSRQQPPPPHHRYLNQKKQERVSCILKDPTHVVHIVCPPPLRQETGEHQEQNDQTEKQFLTCKAVRLQNSGGDL